MAQAGIVLTFQKTAKGYKLAEVIFRHQFLKKTIKSEYSLNEFPWSEGVQALVIFLIRWADWARRYRGEGEGREPRFEGGKSTPAASLDNVLTTKPAWVKKFFGTFGSELLVMSIIERKNSGFKSSPDEPVRLWLDQNQLNPSEIQVEIVDSDGHKPVDDAQELVNIANDIQRQWKRSNTTRMNSTWTKLLAVRDGRQGSKEPEQESTTFGLSVEWTEEGPRVFRNGAEISPLEWTALFNRFLDVYDEQCGQGENPDNAKVVAAISITAQV
jgi:hypothetical protein